MSQLKFHKGELIENRYEIIEELSGGNFGLIYIIKDRELNYQEKILKVLKLDNFKDSESMTKVIELFEREFKVLRALNIFEHKGIPKVDPDGYFKFSYGDQELHCIVMEKINGENLNSWLDKQSKKLSEELAINWMRQLINILDRIHPKYLHRDIKPNNIILKPDGELILIDFGAVKEITQKFYKKSGQNTDIGTPGYASPEQARSSFGYSSNEEFKIDNLPYQSDYFSLGRTFVHLLTGKKPSQLQLDQKNKLIWRDFAPEISDMFKDLIDSMMEYKYNDRPKSSREIIDFLYEIEKIKRKEYGKALIPLWQILISIILNIFLIIMLIDKPGLFVFIVVIVSVNSVFMLSNYFQIRKFLGI